MARKQPLPSVENHPRVLTDVDMDYRALDSLVRIDILMTRLYGRARAPPTVLRYLHKTDTGVVVSRCSVGNEAFPSQARV